MKHTDMGGRIALWDAVQATLKQTGSGEDIEPAEIQIREVLATRNPDNKTRINL